jgi:ABC-type Fe3+ transport system permease subunit/streptogramin lyase
MNWPLFKNSLAVGGLSTLVALLFGVIGALFVFGLPRGGRIAAFTLSIIALALPPFLVTNSWLHFLGPTGVWRGVFHFDISSFGGTIWVLGLMLWPIPMFALLGAWQRLEPPQLESDLAVSGFPLLTRVLLPLGRGALAQTAILVFVLAFNNFSVPTLLQVKTFPSEAWIRFNTSFDSIGAAKLSLPMAAVSVLVILALAGRGGAWPHVQPSAPAALVRRQLGPILFLICAGAAALLFALSAILPLAQILTVERTWTELAGAIEAGQSAIWNSLWLAALCASVILAVSALTAAWARVGGSKARSFTKAASFLGWILWLPFLIPGVLLGIALIALFNHSWSALFYQSAGIVILALSIRYLAFGWNTMAHAWRGADPELADAARMEGANEWQVFRHAFWPQISAQLAAVWYIIFLLCLWDIESIILIIPPRIGETLALRIFNLLHYGHSAQVNALCFTLLVVALTPLLVWTAARTFRSAVQRFGWTAIGVAGALSLLPILLAGCGQGQAGAVDLHSRFFGGVKIIGTRGVGVGQLNKPRSVAVDKHDNLYVLDMTGRVQKFSSNGVYLLSWQMPEIDRGKPKGMCRDRVGNIIVVEPHYSRVNQFTPEGRLLLQWGAPGTNDGQFSAPRAAGVNSKNEIFVAEYLERESVQKFSLNEITPGIGPKWLASFGSPGNGPGQFNRAEGLYVDTHDQVYVADSCNHRIQVFSSHGKLLRTYGKPGRGKGELSYPYDICVDADGFSYVSEFGNSRIQIFDPQGQPVEIIGERGSDLGQFSNPWGIALDSAGNLYVADSQNHRVQELIRRRDWRSHT